MFFIHLFGVANCFIFMSQESMFTGTFAVHLFLAIGLAGVASKANQFKKESK